MIPEFALLIFLAISLAIVEFIIISKRRKYMREESQEENSEEKGMDIVPYNEVSLPSFPRIKKEIIKENFYSIANAEMLFDNGVEKQNSGDYNAALDYYSKALNFFTKKEFPAIFAAIQNNIGSIYRKLAAMEDSKSYMYKAMQVYKEAAVVYANLNYKTELAMIRNNLGVVYHQLAQLTGKEKFFNDAIKSFKEALKVYDIGDYPIEYTSIQNNLGNVYRDASTVSDEKRNLINAANAYNEALKIFKIVSKISGKNNLPVECADIQQNLGEVYSRLAKIEMDRKEAVSMAIESFYNALQIYTVDSHPAEYADIQTRIGQIHLLLAGILEGNDLKDVTYYSEYMKKGKSAKTGTAVRSTKKRRKDIEVKTTHHDLNDEETARRENLSRAIDAYSEALKVYTLEEQPMEYATTQNNLGMSYCVLAGMTKEERDFYNAIDAYSEALKVYTLEEQPMEYALTSSNLAIAYSLLSEISDKEKNLSRAIDAYSEALKVYTLEEQPMEYATTQNNLGMRFTRWRNSLSSMAPCRRISAGCIQHCLK